MLKLPTIAGKAHVGEVLIADAGRWERLRSLSFRWKRCRTKGNDCSVIHSSGHGGVIASRRYKLVASDVGHRIRVSVSARNSWGQTTAASRPTSVVTKATVRRTGGPGGGHGTQPPPNGPGSGTGLHVSAADMPCSNSAATTCSYLLDANGNVVHIHGVDLSGSEYACIQGWGIFSGAQNTQTDVAAMVAWHVNFVRIQLNEDCWLGINTSGISSSYVDTSPGVGSYATAIENLVTLLHQNGIYTEIVDMWNAPGTDQSTGQSGQNSSIGSAYFGPDEDHSPAMWASMAQAFANDPDTILSPAGEEDVSMACQMDGCSNEGVAPSNVDNLGSGSYNGESGYYYNVAGLVSYNGQASQGAVGIMRANGYKGPIALECADYREVHETGRTRATRMANVGRTVSPSNILAEPHNYGTGGCTTQSCWDAQYLPVQEAGFPVFYGELARLPRRPTAAIPTGRVHLLGGRERRGLHVLDVDRRHRRLLRASQQLHQRLERARGGDVHRYHDRGHTSITGVSSTSGLAVGQVVSGSGLPTGDTIISISGSTLTMGLDSTGSASGVSLTAQEGGPGWVKAHLESFVNAAPMTNISRRSTAYGYADSGGSCCGDPGSYAIDNEYGSDYGGGHVFDCGPPCGIALDLSSLPSSERQDMIVMWGNSSAWDPGSSTGLDLYDAPGNYTIDTTRPLGEACRPAAGRPR